ncbi:hypothetical protein FJY90_01175 [Candidatus Gottesmanbacteria bacterium]|nr:hypothetical protein [Candidatus Gottesmanbacteria bacterium]
MSRNSNIIKKILQPLEINNLIKQLERVKTFYDEPPIYQYRGFFNFPVKFTDGETALRSGSIHSGGSSLISKYDALLKCLVESVERINLYCFDKKKIIFSSKNNLKENSLDLRTYITESSINDAKFGWIKGFNLTKKESCYIPAQLAYLNYHNTFNYKEKMLSIPISTGAAAGFDHYNVLARGICEVIERDAFMTCYLIKRSAPKINLDILKSPIVKKLKDDFKRYKLMLHLFDITSDLVVPTYLAIITDKTEVGPVISIGAKTSLIVKDAILGSICEALVGRIWTRSWMHKKRKLVFQIKPSAIRTPRDRALYWSNKKMLGKLDFLLKTDNYAVLRDLGLKTPKEQLNCLVDRINRRGYQVYYVDLTLDIFKKINCRVYQTIIPGLQPLYLDERMELIKKERLNQTAKYFNVNDYRINNVPHCFL